MAVDPRDASTYDTGLVTDLQATYRRGDPPPYSRDPYTDPKIRGRQVGRRIRLDPRRMRWAPRR